MKVVITEGGTANNVGSMALIENAIKIAKEKHPDCKITVFCLDKDSVETTLKKDGITGIKVINDLFPIPNGNKLVKTVWLLQCILWIFYSRFVLLFTNKISSAFFGRRKQNLKEVEDADYIYCIGAERINDIYFKTALLSLYAIGTYIKMGKKLIHFSLTIGPVFKSSTIKLAKKILNNSYAIFVRDQKSFDILQKWNCKAPFQFNSFDIALLQNKADSNSLLSDLGIHRDFIGVSCIYWLFRKVKGPVRQPEYEDAIARTLDYIVDKYKYQIVFTPTVVGTGEIDDVQISHNIVLKMKNQGSVVIIDRLLTPVEIASLFSFSKFSIVTRMHAAILCSGSGGRPIIAINYLYKLREYMKNIQCEDSSIDIDYTNSEDLKQFVDTLLSHYDFECEKLSQRQNHLRNQLVNDISKI